MLSTGVGLTVRFNFRALLVFTVFLAPFGGLMHWGSREDLLVRAVIWTLVAAMSVVAVVGAIMRGGVYGQDATVPKRLRRWLLGESDDEESER